MAAHERYEVLGNEKDGHGFVILDHSEHAFVRVHASSSLLVLRTKRQAEALAKVMNLEYELNEWFKSMADSGLQKSVEALDAIDEMNEAHYNECEFCQHGEYCEDMELRKMYQDSAFDTAVTYMEVRSFYGT